MKKNIVVVLLILCSSLNCSTVPKSTNEMRKRAGYDVDKQEKRPSRKKTRIEKIWVGRRLLSSGDYLQEGIVHLVVEESKLIFEDENLPILR